VEREGLSHLCSVDAREQSGVLRCLQGLIESVGDFVRHFLSAVIFIGFELFCVSESFWCWSTMSKAHTHIVVAAKANGTNASRLNGSSRQWALGGGNCESMELPPFKISGFDSTIKLTDDLARADAQVESYLRRIERTLTEADKELQVQTSDKQVCIDHDDASVRGFYYKVGLHGGKTLYKNPSGTWILCEDSWRIIDRVSGKVFSEAAKGKDKEENAPTSGWSNGVTVQMKELVSPIAFDGEEREYCCINEGGRWLPVDESIQKKFWSGSTAASWNVKKFDPKLPAASLLDMIQRTAGSLEEDFKQIATEYNDSKTKKAAVSFKDTGSHSTRDLLDIVTPDRVVDAKEGSPNAADDFIFTQSLVTVLVCIPKGGEVEFQNWYEGDVEKEKVIPQSLKRINVDPDKDGLSLYRVVVYNKDREVDEFKKSCRDNKFIVRDYPYSSSWYATSVLDREHATANFVISHMRLVEAGLASFSELFGIWMHLKMLRAGIEGVLRYGVNEKLEVFFVCPDPNRLPQARLALSEVFGSKADRAMDVGGDEEEFYPYVSLTLQPLTTSK